MKRIMAWMLALMIAASLCVPVSADYTDEYWEGYDAGWDAGYDDGYADFEDGAKPPVAVGTYEEGYDTGYTDGYESGYGDAEQEDSYYNEEYDAGYADGYDAGYADGLNGEYNDAWDGEDPDSYDTGYLEGYDAGYFDALLGESDETSPENVIASYGGVPGQINVMLDGMCINFADAVPVNQNGRVMVPVRAILEALGATVDYDQATKTVQAELNGEILRHVIGTETVEIYAGGDLAEEPEIIMMDCKSYISGGRTMVPVRFISEALGYDVDWDGDYKTVVILDLDGLCESYDAQLTAMNLVLSDMQKLYEPGMTYKQETDLDLELTLFDTLNGDQKIRASADMTALYDDVNANVSLDMDLTQVMDLLTEEDMGITSEELEQMEDHLKKLQVDLIYNGETGQFYLRSPLIDVVTGKETWIESGVEEVFGVDDPESLLPEMPADEYTLAGLTAALYQYSGSSSPIFHYEELVETLDGLVMIVGDDTFRTSGNTYTWDLDNYLASQDLTAMYDMIGIYPEGDEKISLKFSVTDTGNGTCNYDLQLYWRTEELELDLSDSKKAANETMTLSLHVRNLFEAELTVDSAASVSSEEIRTAPEADEVSTGLDDIYS